MKILHTSDWHLGKRLHQADLIDDQRHFTEWLVNMVKAEQVDVVLIAGDVFDLANPSSEARKIYYETLVELSRMNCTTIITGGNHDAPTVLNAPKEILRALNIHVVGGLPEDPREMIIPVEGRQKGDRAVIAAIPFLRDADLRNAVPGESHEDRREAVKAGITGIFDQVARICREDYPGLPAIAMGHLFARGADVSESERDIQVGNQAPYEPEHFNSHFDRLALGHIHKPQPAESSGRARYSGSPLPLSFSERADHKKVIIYQTNNGTFNAHSITIPVVRRLKKIQGSLQHIRQVLNQPQEEDGLLPTLIEVEMVEEQEDPQKITDLENLIDDFNNPRAQVVKHRVHFKNMISGTNQLYDSSQHIENLRPADVFEKKLERSGLGQRQKELLREAFTEILQALEQKESS